MFSYAPEENASWIVAVERNEQKWLQREKEAQLKWEEDCRQRKLLKEREEEAQVGVITL
ncbi:unnamed protein product [Trichobilharzia regenti]|nr:unnamed protein product [Trichobilharzia regenti]